MTFCRSVVPTVQPPHRRGGLKAAKQPWLAIAVKNQKWDKHEGERALTILDAYETRKQGGLPKAYQKLSFGEGFKHYERNK